MASLMGKGKLGDAVGNCLAKVDDGHNASVQTLHCATRISAVATTHATLGV